MPIGKSSPSTSTSIDSSKEKTFWRIILSIYGGYLFGILLVSASRYPSSAEVASALGIAISAGLAAAIFGALLGFLFGIPRSFSAKPQPDGGKEPVPADSTPSHSMEANGSERQGKADAQGYENNNLVEVSDWLTKIIIGAGLVQIEHLASFTGKMGLILGQSAGLPMSIAAGFGVAVVLMNFGLGFIVMYIYARTLLALMFANAKGQIEDELKGAVREMREAQKIQEGSAERTASIVTQVADQLGGPSAVLAQLYRPKPYGFKKAIELAEALLKTEEYRDSAKLWGYLACAYGQKFGFDNVDGSDSENLERTALLAFEATKRAIELEPSRLKLLKRLWDPTDPKYNPTENDLTPLWTDENQREKFALLLQDTKD